MTGLGAVFARALLGAGGDGGETDNDQAANLAIGLMLAGPPSDRALIGWQLPPEQIAAVRVLAQRRPR